MAKLNRVRLSVLLLGCLGGMAGAHAQLLADPTRPAAEWLATQPVLPGGEVAGSGAESGVQVLVIGRARKFAIVDGQLVRQGESYNGARLVGIRHDGVVMQRDGSKETLSMNPAVEKKVRASKPAVRKGKAKPEKIVVNGEGQ